LNRGNLGNTGGKDNETGTPRKGKERRVTNVGEAQKEGKRFQKLRKKGGSARPMLSLRKKNANHNVETRTQKNGIKKNDSRQNCWRVSGWGRVRRGRGKGKNKGKVNQRGKKVVRNKTWEGKWRLPERGKEFPRKRGNDRERVKKKSHQTAEPGWGGGEGMKDRVTRNGKKVHKEKLRTEGQRRKEQKGET